MDNNNLYKDINARTGGEIYLGIVGPVRTGKSTFIRKFMNHMIIPAITDPNERERVVDELPQAAEGRTVMTTEPKFIPKEAVEINLGNNITARFRLIDCVGYIVNEAQGIYENEQERLVKTPWFENSIPFSKAAEYGTSKVIKEHSTIGIVITTDGTIGEIGRSSYIEAEHKAITELLKIQKPFIVIVNSAEPSSQTAQQTVQEINNKYGVSALALDVENLGKNDIIQILKTILYEFPVECLEFYMPKWVEFLPKDNEIKEEILRCAQEILYSVTSIKDIKKPAEHGDTGYISDIKYDDFDFSTGIQRIKFEINEKYYYEHLSEIMGEDIKDEFELITMVRNLSSIKKDFERYVDVAKTAKIKGYGVVMPDRDEIMLSEPEVIKTGNKFGVKIKAESPSIHMIKVNIGTEISPIVGTEAQAKDLMEYINESTKEGNVWDTNIFGKSIGELVEDGIKGKISMINDDCQVKLQETMQKVVNETSGGLVCLII